MEFVDIAAVQAPRMSIDEAYEYVSGKLEESLKGTEYDVLLMPEKWINGNIEEAAEGIGRIIRHFTELSRDTGSVIVPGSFSVYRNGKLFNSAPVIFNGKILGWQDKIALFREEKKYYTQGKEIRVFDAAGLKIGVAVCYDADFPYFTKVAVSKGAEIMLNPSLIVKKFHDMWYIYIKSRSLENRVPYVSVNSISDPFYGSSIITRPEPYDFGVKLYYETFSDETVIKSRVNISTLRDLISTRFQEDPGSYSLNSDKLI